MPIALLALTISAFAIGTTEFVIVGLLPTMAADLGVSLTSAGLLVSLYALGVAVGAPVLTALTGKLPRKTLLLALMALFTVGNLVAWQAPSYEALVVARILTGLAHGVFFSIGSTIATGLVPREKAASAIAIMFTGLTVALVTGVPLGTFIGQNYGWRATFLAVSGLGLIAFIGSALFVPRTIAHTASASLKVQASVLLQPRLLLVYAMTAVGYGGSFIAFTFLAPLLQEVSGFEAGAVALVMLVAIWLLLTRTRVGLVIQAALTHPETVESLGNNVPRVFMLVFGAGCALAGLAGVIGGSTFLTEPSMAFTVGSIIFVVVVVGGMGSLSGAFVASLLIGIVQTFAVAFEFSLLSVADHLGLTLSEAVRNNSYVKLTLSQAAPILPYLFLVLILIFRPRGLLGKREG